MVWIETQMNLFPVLFYESQDVFHLLLKVSLFKPCLFSEGLIGNFRGYGEFYTYDETLSGEA